MSKEAMKLALNKAFQLGQRYWSWADSEYSSHWKKADAAKAEFDQLVQDTINAALAEQTAQQEPVAGCDSIEAIAAARYKVVPSHDSMFYRHAVVAGNGTQQLYIGREVECENMARKFAGAFLDGAFVMQSRTSQSASKPWVGLTDDDFIGLTTQQIFAMKFAGAKLKEKNT
jgi:hypothetical protein